MVAERDVNKGSNLHGDRRPTWRKTRAASRGGQMAHVHIAVSA
jgi:hypothetical protein